MGASTSSRSCTRRPDGVRSVPLSVGSDTVAVRWHLRYGLSYRDVEELLAERGVEADHVTVYRWVQRFTPLFTDAARPLRHATGDRWFVDEAYFKIAGRWRYLYRAVGQSDRSSTCCCLNSGTPRPPADSSPALCATDRRRSR